MRTRTTFIGCCAAILSALPAPRTAWSQVPDSATIDRLARAGSVRITAAGHRTRAPGSAVSASGVMVGTDSLLPWPGISRAEVVRSYIGRGAAVGAVVGGLLGLGAGLAATRKCTCSGFCFEICGAGGNEVALATLGGAGAGALVGLLIAAPFGGWRPVYDQATGTGVGSPGIAPVVTRDADGKRRIGVRVRLQY